MSKMSLTEATMLALQGKLIDENISTNINNKRLKKESIDINVDDKTNVSIIDNETIVDTEDATIIVDKKQNEFIPETSDGIAVVDDTTLPMEAPVDTIEVPIEGDETIIPEEIVDEPTVEPDVEKEEESKKLEAKSKVIAYNIKWDVDTKAELKNLPKEIVIPDVSEDLDDDLDDDLDEISDYITELTGYCHNGFELKRVNENKQYTTIESKKLESTKLQEWIKDESDLKQFLAHEIGNRRADLKDKIDMNNFEYDEIVNNIFNKIDEIIDYQIDQAIEIVYPKDGEVKEESKERTTKDVYVIQGNYGQGWEDLIEEDDRKEAKARLKEYNENEREYSHRLITRRVKKESKETCEKCDNEICECDKKVESKKLQEKLGYEPGICPNCGSDNLSYEKPISYTDNIEYPFHCNNCGKDGTERYNLDFAESETNELNENKKVEKKSFKFESKKLQEELTDETVEAAEKIAKEIRKVGCMNFQDIDNMAMEILGIDVDTYMNDQINIDIYSCLNYEGIFNNFGDGDFYTEEYAKEHPEVLEENVNIEVSDDGKEIEVTTDEGEVVETKDETPDDVERPVVEIEDELDESKKLNEDYSAAPFRDLMYDCMQDDIEPADVMADRMLSAWSDDDCKWYCETYELVTPYKDFSDENEYYKDVYGNIRDISGQIVEDEINESKNKKAESVKMIETRNKKKFENKVRNIKVESTNKITTDIINLNESLKKALKLEKVEKARIEENNGKILLKAKVMNENKVKGICFEMKESKKQDNFVRYSLQEIKSVKFENKQNTTSYSMLMIKKGNMLECKYIIKK